jgi:hypothetical protein
MGAGGLCRVDSLPSRLPEIENDLLGRPKRGLRLRLETFENRKLDIARTDETGAFRCLHGALGEIVSRPQPSQPGERLSTQQPGEGLVDMVHHGQNARIPYPGARRQCDEGSVDHDLGRLSEAQHERTEKRPQKDAVRNELVPEVEIGKIHAVQRIGHREG